MTAAGLTRVSVPFRQASAARGRLGALIKRKIDRANRQTGSSWIGLPAAHRQIENKACLMDGDDALRRTSAHRTNASDPGEILGEPDLSKLLSRDYQAACGCRKAVLLDVSSEPCYKTDE